MTCKRKLLSPVGEHAEAFLWTPRIFHDGGFTTSAQQVHAMRTPCVTPIPYFQVLIALLAGIGAFSLLHILGFGLIYKVCCLATACLLLGSSLVSPELMTVGFLSAMSHLPSSCCPG